eukprot:TRINITY_DN815_c0_g2_i1.p1 TRINITY_DN815_c0_g2~~TRINITY_DN815_c0_g2_i1.p1  ORF type:complete len:1028 (-),score=349.69 TRINITY_DN815_c0_g2_i1:1629-4712(-)
MPGSTEMITPSTKQLWGSLEDSSKGTPESEKMLNLNDAMWREGQLPGGNGGTPPWNPTDLNLPRRSPAFPSVSEVPRSANGVKPAPSNPGGNLSNPSNGKAANPNPKSSPAPVSAPQTVASSSVTPKSEGPGSGVKFDSMSMVEYVLGNGPTQKSIEESMARLNLKTEVEIKKEEPDENEASSGPEGAGGENGFRALGSRQPSPSNETNGIKQEIKEESPVDSNFSQVIMDHNSVPFGSLAPPDGHFQLPHLHGIGGPPHGPSSGPPLLGLNGAHQDGFSHDNQNVYRSHSSLQGGAGGTNGSVNSNGAGSGNSAAVAASQQAAALALLPHQQQTQQFLTAQQIASLQAYGPAGAGGGSPYLINAQDQYLPAGALVPGQGGALPLLPISYPYGLPWGVYPAAGLLQQNGGGNASNGGPNPLGQAPSGQNSQGSSGAIRRPGTPGTPGSDVAPGYQQMVPAFYDQTGNLVRLGSVPPLRLLPPAGQLLINNAAIAAAAAGLGNAAAGRNTLPGFGGNNNNLGSLGGGASAASLSASLSGFSSGRRDSADRNTSNSGFSPSLNEQPFGKSSNKSSGGWPNNYGPIGVSAGGLNMNSGSLTPPPPGGLRNGLGGLNFNGGADRFNSDMRNGAGGGVFGSFGSNNLFSSNSSSSNGVGGKTPRHNSCSSIEKPSPSRSRLLEDFRNNRFPSITLRDLSDHVVEFSQDQHGSRFIQQKLEKAPSTDKQIVFQEILAAAYVLMTDVFGNYVIQKFFDFGSPEQKDALVQKLRTHVQSLALQMYGCRVIQKALESINLEQQKLLIAELEGNVLKCVKDQNGNHVVQKCIESVEPSCLQFIIDSFKGQVFSLSTHPYGCRVIQRILEHCQPEQTSPILEELHQNMSDLLQDQYGNYVVQHVLEHGNTEDKSKIVSAVRGNVLSLSQHKFASNVVEKCVQNASRPERAILIDEVCSLEGPQCPLHSMMKDQYANYVVQKMIDVAEQSQRKILMHKIKPHVSTLRKYTYGKHILAKLEKYFLKNNTDLGPIGPPGSL